MARRPTHARRCDFCGKDRALILQLILLRNVYTYRWLCARCRAVDARSRAGKDSHGNA
jgi:hypothetical protein